MDAFSQFFFGHDKSTKTFIFSWATPLRGHQESVYRVFDPKNEDFYYGAYNIKWILMIQGNI